MLLEHVEVERTACFTDSTGEPGSSVETVMVGGGGMKTVLQSLTIDDDGGSSHAFDVIMTAGREPSKGARCRSNRSTPKPKPD